MEEVPGTEVQSGLKVFSRQSSRWPGIAHLKVPQIDSPLFTSKVSPLLFLDLVDSQCTTH